MQRIIGLTGPTGAGKSEAAQILNAYGGAIVDADRAARRAVENAACLQALQTAFGSDICRPDGILDRKELARRAFAAPEKTQRLNEITHPYIRAQMRTELRQALDHGAPFVVLDAPLLLESGLDADCEAILVVLADPEVRVRRICARDGLSEADARLRMHAQHPDAFYTQRATAVFYNNTTPDDLRRAVQAWIMQYRSGKEQP